MSEEVNRLKHNLKNYEHTKENKDEILRAYFYAYHEDKITNEFEQPFEEVSLDEMTNFLPDLIIDNITDIEYSAELCSHRMITFMFTFLDKFSESEEGISIVKSEDMPRNFSKEENDFLVLCIDVVMAFYQFCVERSELSEEQAKDWDLDMANYAKKVFSSEYLRFDSKIDNNNLHKILYGF